MPTRIFFGSPAAFARLLHPEPASPAIRARQRPRAQRDFLGSMIVPRGYPGGRGEGKDDVGPLFAHPPHRSRTVVSPLIKESSNERRRSLYHQGQDHHGRHRGGGAGGGES